jgi:hypothetical protein
VTSSANTRLPQSTRRHIMDNNQYHLNNQWPAQTSAYQNLVTEQWDPGFDAERCVVFAKLGPYQKLFERPANFTKRFFHTLYPLPIEHWEINDQVGLYDNFCTIDVDLVIHFQATLKYVTSHEIELGHINANIKAAYDDWVRNIVQNQLLSLDDARWVQTGLQTVEQAIALVVNELFLVHDLQATTICSLNPVFKAFPELKFKEEAAYLLMLKKSFELTTQKQQEQFLHEQILEHQKQEQERIRLETLKAEQQLALLRQAQEAEHLKQSLLDQEAQQRERFDIEQRLHADKVKQDTLLSEMSLTGKYQLIEKKEFFERQLAEKTIDEKIAHQTKIKEKELAAKIKLYESEKNSWNKIKDQQQINEIKQKQRQKQLQINAELENKAFLHQQQLLLDDQIKREKLRHEEQLKAENKAKNSAEN